LPFKSFTLASACNGAIAFAKRFSRPFPEPGDQRSSTPGNQFGTHMASGIPIITCPVTDLNAHANFAASGPDR